MATTHVEQLKGVFQSNKELMKVFPRFEEAIHQYIDASILDLEELEDLEEAGRRVKIFAKMRKDISSYGHTPPIQERTPRPKLRRSI